MPKQRRPTLALADLPKPRLTVAEARRWRRDWDLQQSREVLDREARFGALLNALDGTVGPRFRVLDLGCGTGSLSERILHRFPRARSVAVDFDPVLLAIGRQGLGTMRGRLTWVDADLRSRTWPSRLPPGPFDAVVSTTALHWLRSRELTRLFHDLIGVVRPGGWLFNGDRISYPASEPHFREAARLVRGRRRRQRPRVGASWEQWWRRVLREPHLAEEVALHHRRYPHSHHDVPTPSLSGQVRRLRSAGFTEVDLVWTEWDNRVLAARR